MHSANMLDVRKDVDGKIIQRLELWLNTLVNRNINPTIIQKDVAEDSQSSVHHGPQAFLQLLKK